MQLLLLLLIPLLLYSSINVSNNNNNNLLLTVIDAISPFDATGYSNRISLLEHESSLTISPSGVIYGTISGNTVNALFQLIPNTNSNNNNNDPIIQYITDGQNSAHNDGECKDAKFAQPSGIAVNQLTPLLIKLYIADSDNYRIRLVTIQYSSTEYTVPMGSGDCVVSTLAGKSTKSSDISNKAVNSVQFFSPTSLVLARSGLFIVDKLAQCVRFIPLVNDHPNINKSHLISDSQNNAVVITIISDLNTPSGITVYIPPGSNSKNQINNITATLFVSQLHSIIALYSSGHNETISGRNAIGTADGNNTVALFNQPAGLYADESQRLYIADQGSNTIRVMLLDSPGYIVYTVLGQVGISGYPADNHQTLPLDSLFQDPKSITLLGSVSEKNYLYISDSVTIRRATAICLDSCKNAGNCTAFNLCTCTAGYNGTNCGLPICTNTGTTGQVCSAPNIWECPIGYTGTNCSTPICTVPCINGICIAPNQCSCDSGWELPNCAAAICPFGCIHGSCTSPGNCTCVSNDWYGNRCELPNCTLPCKNGFSCIAPNICNCTNQYSKIDCSQPVCTQSCLNNGTCSAPDFCTCQFGYNGTSCQNTICNQTCLNGYCDLPGHCACNSGWIGIDCSIAVCSQPCLNGGNCTGPNNCTCPTGWGNINTINFDCRDPICNPICNQLGLLNAQQCVPSAYNYPMPPPICISACTSITCDHGSCNGINQCLCDSGWGANSNCSKPECNPACSNGGTCVAPNTCACIPGYNPIFQCRVPICTTPCAFGVCSAPDYCTCLDGYSFHPIYRNCSIPVCYSNLGGCANNGTCTSPGICTCPSGYTDGFNCAQPQCRDCNPIGGLCVAPETCQCHLGLFEGRSCRDAVIASQSIFNQFYDLFVILGCVVVILVVLAVGWQWRKHRDKLKKRKFAYASEFDATKEIKRERKRKQKERAKLAAEQKALKTGVPVHALKGHKSSVGVSGKHKRNKSRAISGGDGLNSIKGRHKHNKRASVDLSNAPDNDPISEDTKQLLRAKDSVFTNDDHSTVNNNNNNNRRVHDDIEAQLINADGDAEAESDGVELHRIPIVNRALSSDDDNIGDDARTLDINELDTDNNNNNAQ